MPHYYYCCRRFINAIIATPLFIATLPDNHTGGRALAGAGVGLGWPLIAARDQLLLPLRLFRRRRFRCHQAAAAFGRPAPPRLRLFHCQRAAAAVCRQARDSPLYAAPPLIIAIHAIPAAPGNINAYALPPAAAAIAIVRATYHSVRTLRTPAAGNTASRRRHAATTPLNIDC